MDKKGDKTMIGKMKGAILPGNSVAGVQYGRVSDTRSHRF